MKFKTDADKILLLQEVLSDSIFADLKLTLEDLEDPKIQSVIAVRRGRLLKRLKNFRKSQVQKQNWRKGHHKYLKGIRDFHKSMAGKKFHRALARFVVSRGILKKPKNKTEFGTSSRLRESLHLEEYQYHKVVLSRYDQSDLLTLLSATRNHLILETKYYLPLSEEADYLVMMEIVLPELTKLCTRLEESIIDCQEIILSKEEFALIDSFLGGNYYDEFDD